MARPTVNPETFPVSRDCEEWLRSSLYGLTGECWELSYVHSCGGSQSWVIYAREGDREIAFCEGEPRSHELLIERVRCSLELRNV